MSSKNQNAGVKGVRGVRAGAALAVALLGACGSRAAMVIPITSADVPVSNPSSVFDAGNAGNTYSLAAGTSFIPEGFDARDLFGGSFGTFGPEHNDVIFANNQPIGTVDSVDVTLGGPISLQNFSLFLEDDGPGGDRSASEFRLYAGGQLIDDISLLDGGGRQSYTSVYGSNYLQISDSFTDLPAASDFELQFVQNRDGNDTSGLRAMEFQGAGGASAVPEPSSLAGVAIAVFSLSQRGRRI